LTINDGFEFFFFKLFKDVEQCIEESFERKQKYSALEGCNLHGYILVNKVAGNIHLIPGKSTQTEGGISHGFVLFF
jgi:hypothetical protein